MSFSLFKRLRKIRIKEESSRKLLLQNNWKIVTFHKLLVATVLFYFFMNQNCCGSENQRSSAFVFNIKFANGQAIKKSVLLIP